MNAYIVKNSFLPRDLAFSFVKRQYGVKDYGKLLPGHGGMLDRFDSMIFCGPVVLFVLYYLPVF